MSYTHLISQINTLNSWDPKTQYISHSLNLEKKTKSKGCWQRFCALFRKAKAKQAVVAFEKLNRLVNQFSFELSQDSQTCFALQSVTARISNVLVEGKEGRRIQNKKTRNAFSTRCHKLSLLCLHAGKQNIKALGLFAKSIPTQELTLHQASHHLEAMTSYIKSCNTILSKKNPQHYKLANRVLIVAQNIKKQFLGHTSKLSTQQLELKQRYLDLQEVILRQIFSKKINSQREKLKILFKRYQEIPPNKAVEAFLNRCLWKNVKGKPFSLPDWFHFTTPDSLKPILKSQKILYAQKGMYPGAFVATVPETRYGQIGFGFSKRINRFAYQNPTQKTQPNPPLITNCDINADSPVYLGKKPPAKNNYHQTKTLLNIWAGFKQAISFSKPQKSLNPLGYYRATNLSLLAYDNYSFLSQSTTSILESLKKQQKIHVMKLSDLHVLNGLIRRSFHLHLDATWGDALVQGFASTSLLKKRHHVISS